jgi:hypothetical protein
MKKGILLLLLAGSFTAKAQSLKELLYSGKLKTDSSSVIRKTDDLKSKIDTGQQKQAEPEKVKITAAPGDSSVRAVDPVTDSTAIAEIKDTAAAAVAGIKNTPAPVKSNNKIWKEYTDSLVSSLKTEVLSSKKIKKETYYLTVEYEIAADGQVAINNVMISPENDFLQNQVKERMLLAPPQLSPALDRAGQARKVKRKYNFNITKE